MSVRSLCVYPEVGRSALAWGEIIPEGCRRVRCRVTRSLLVETFKSENLLDAGNPVTRYVTGVYALSTRTLYVICKENIQLFKSKGLTLIPCYKCHCNMLGL